jgi:hypothetical protein
MYYLVMLLAVMVLCGLLLAAALAVGWVVTREIEDRKRD